MPNIRPVSDLENYTEVLQEVDATGRVYLERDGRGKYVILAMAEIEELDRYKEALVRKEGWTATDDL